MVATKSSTQVFTTGTGVAASNTDTAFFTIRTTFYSMRANGNAESLTDRARYIINGGS
jgi:hypothetical protein